MIREARSQRTLLAAVFLFNILPNRLGVRGATPTVPLGSAHGGSPLVVAWDHPITGCPITLDGSSGDWTVSCVGNNLWFPGSAPTGTPTISAAKLAVSHFAHPSPGAPFDTLYVYIGVTGDNTTGNLAQDNVVLMLDTQHDALVGSTGDRGVRFKRDATVESVSGDPTAPTVGASPTGSDCIGQTQRACILTAGNQWNIEAKLLPSDFGLNAFAGTMGIVLVARDNAMAPTFWPSTPSPATSAPNTWADIKLGNPIDLMLVLDLSGSMGDQTCNPPPCEPKLQKLKAAADLLIGLFNAVAVPADRIGVRYFSTDATAFPAPPTTLVSVLDNWPIVQTNINGQAASGWTAMGAGLQWGINDLTDASRTRAIVLFTDGMQNVDPMVHDDGAGNLTIQYEGRPIVSTVVLPKNPATALDMNLGMNVNTVGMGGAMDAFTALLDAIATNTGGKYDATTEPNELQSLFVTQLTYALRTHSPQLVAYRLGTMSRTTATETFTVNNGARKLVFAVTWPKGDSLIFRVEKDNVDVTSAGQMVATDLYRILAISLPTRVQATDISSGGDWRVLIQGTSGVPYQAMAISDEPFLEYDVGFENEDYTVGDSLRLRARVTYAGQPVTDARATATLFKPTLAIGTLLCESATPPPPPNVRSADTTSAQNKLERLLANPAVRQRLQPSAQDVVLRGRGDGTYTFALGGTTVAGSYSARFQVEGSRPDIGAYRRVQTASRMVHFGQADLLASAVEVKSLGVSSAGRRLSLYLRPSDGINCLGPEFGSRIKVSLTSGTVGPATDLLDGTYTFPLLVPQNSDPVITVTVMGEPFYQGPLSKLSPQQRNALSLHAGVSLPQGSFKNAYKNGVGITVDFEHRLSNTFSLAALLGYHRFEGDTTGARLDLYHASGSLEVFLTQGPLVVFLDAGGGAYRLNPGTTQGGAHAGANIEYEVSPSLSLGGSYRLHTVFTSGEKVSFSTIQGGGRFKF